MKTKRELSRLAVARRLQDIALRIAAGKPVSIGGVAVRVPERIIVEEELESKSGKTELEIELSWPRASSESPTARKPRTANPPKARRTS